MTFGVHKNYYKLDIEDRYLRAKQPGLIRTCRQIRNESLRLFYELNTFYLSTCLACQTYDLHDGFLRLVVVKLRFRCDELHLEVDLPDHPFQTLSFALMDNECGVDTNSYSEPLRSRLLREWVERIVEITGTTWTKLDHTVSLMKGFQPEGCTYRGIVV